MTICVSVVVPTYRRNDLLRRCLAALAAQDCDPDSYEIVIVDDAASDATRQLVEDAGWRASGSATGQPGGRAHAPGGESRGGDASSPAAGNTALTAGGAGDNADAHRLSLARQAAPAATGLGLAAANALPDEILSLPWLEGPEPTDRPPDPIPGLAPESSGVAFPARPAGAAVAAPRVRYVPVAGGPRGPATARNLGWRAAEGEIVAFTDDDCIPAPGWLAAGVAAFAPDVVGVSGRICMPLAGVPTDYELDATGLARSEFVTANCFYRRAALARAGGFDERFSIAWREDSDLFFTLMETWPGGFVGAPNATVVHPIRTAPWGISLRQQRKNMFNALLFKKHPRLYRARLGARPPWHYYAIVAALLAVPLGLLLDQRPTAVAATVVWLVLTLRLAARRLACTSRAPAHVAEMALTSVLIPPLALFWRLAGAIRYRVLFL